MLIERQLAMFNVAGGQSNLVVKCCCRPKNIPRTLVASQFKPVASTVLSLLHEDIHGMDDPRDIPAEIACQTKA